MSVLLFDECETGGGTGRVPEDSSVSSIPTARQGLTAPLLLPQCGSEHAALTPRVARTWQSGTSLHE
jgi:hypothetical protein